MKKPVSITLFHMNTCVHCVNFRSTWETMKKECAPYKMFDFAEYEYDEMEKLDTAKRTIGGAQIDSFPTIKLEILGKEYKFEGNRTNENIYKYILTKLRHALKK